MYRCWCCIVLSLRVGSLSVLCDEIVLLDDVIARRLFKALLPRINVLLVRMAGLPAVKIESPAEGEKRREKFNHREKFSLIKSESESLWAFPVEFCHICMHRIHRTHVWCFPPFSSTQPTVVKWNESEQIGLSEHANNAQDEGKLNKRYAKVKKLNSKKRKSFLQKYSKLRAAIPPEKSIPE